MKILRYTVSGEKYDIPCIAYEPDRDACGAVVCLHGFGGDKESSAVKRLGMVMAELGRSVVCFDFPAHGESQAEDSELTVENCINNAVTVSANAESKYGSISFFATSFGAFVLINILERSYFKGSKAVLRSPAVRMEGTFLSPICNLTIAELKDIGTVECGYERKMRLGYDFWLDLSRHCVGGAVFENKTLMIYGDCDDVVRPADMTAFAAERANIKTKIISGADHRFKGKGQMEEVIKTAARFLLT